MSTVIVREKRGDSLSIQCVIRDGANGPPIDLTGWTVTSWARHSAGVEQELTVTVTDAAGGALTLSLTPAQMEAMLVGDWSVDIKRDNGLGQVERSKTFTLQIIERITP